MSSEVDRRRERVCETHHSPSHSYSLSKQGGVPGTRELSHMALLLPSTTSPRGEEEPVLGTPKTATKNNFQNLAYKPILAQKNSMGLRTAAGCPRLNGRKGWYCSVKGHLGDCPRVLASKIGNRKRVLEAPPHTMSLKLCHYGFGEALETIFPSFWHGGEGCEIPVSARALEDRFVGPKYAAGRSSVFF